MLKILKQKIENALTPHVQNLPISPNAITIASIIPSILFLLFLVNHLYFLALLMLLGTTLDMFDGIIARAQNKTSALGSFLDATVDRLTDALIIVAFGFSQIASWEIVIPLLILSFLISYAKSRGELVSNNRVKFDIGLIERPQRIMFIFLSLLLYILFPTMEIFGLGLLELGLAILALLSLYTIIERVAYAYIKLRSL